jgi:hypothetical protein
MCGCYECDRPCRRRRAKKFVRGDHKDWFVRRERVRGMVDWDMLKAIESRLMWRQFTQEEIGATREEET